MTIYKPNLWAGAGSLCLQAARDQARTELAARKKEVPCELANQVRYLWEEHGNSYSPEEVELVATSLLTPGSRYFFCVSV